MTPRKSQPKPPIDAALRTALGGPGRALGAERPGLERTLGADLSRLRLHTGPEVDSTAARLGARGFALGRAVALARTARPETLAHEAAHAVQQDMAAPPNGAVPLLAPDHALERQAAQAARGAPVRLSTGAPPRLALDRTDPDRLGALQESVQVTGPTRPAPSGGSGAARLPWVDGPVNDPNSTAHLLYTQIHRFLSRRTFNRSYPTHTTASNLDTDAVAANQLVLTKYPQITSPLSDSEIQNRVGLVTPSSVGRNPAYLNAWMDNFIEQMSDSENYQIDATNTHYRAMITALINNPDVGPKIVTLASRAPAFTTGQGRARRIYMHRRVTASRRKTTLIHEIVHLYRHTRYRAWVDASRDPRHYDEGLTEWLAQRVMTSAQRGTRSGHRGYEARVRTVTNQIVPHVSEDALASAYFAGEVWRLETRSTPAREAFADRTGIRESGTRSEERTASRSAAGLMQTVQPGQHFRFINLGVGQAQPKPDHEAAFMTLKMQHMDPAPAVKLRFVGHASGPGSLATNQALSRRRSVAFYRMARRVGVPWSRMIDANRPPHFGETRPNITEEDTITRAMNRRVDLFFQTGSAP